MKKILVFILFLLITPLMGEDEVELYSNSLQFKQNNRLVIASSNVHLHLGDISISTDKLTLDVDKNIAFGTGNILIQRGEDQFKSSYFYLDIDNKTVMLKDIKLRITPHEEKGDLYFRAKTLIDTKKMKYGTRGRVTSCDLPNHPHHYLWAYKFQYLPSKRLVIFGGILYNEFNLFPLNYLPPIPLLEAYPLPYYSYELGKRKVVWNFPVIGKKEKDTWGYFIQNSIDYKHSNRKDSSLLVDYFEYKGMGFGVRHHYDYKRNEGMFYYYNFDFDELERIGGKNVRTGNKKKNRNIEVDNTYHATEFFDVKTKYKLTDLDERINSTGKSKSEGKEFTLDYNQLGDKYKLYTKEHANFDNSTKFLNLKLDSHFNDEKRYGFNLYDNTYYSTSRIKNKHSYYYNLYLPNKWKVENNATYTKDDYLNDSLAADEQVKTYTKIKKRFSSNLDLDIRVEQMLDLDEDNVSTDNADSRNNFLFKHPEININHNRKKMGLNFTQKVSLGRYQEARYDRASKTRRIYPENSDSTIEPNAYYFNNKVSKTLQNKKHKTTLNLSSSYEQYIFKNPDKNLFEGDAIYGLNFNASLKKDSFNHIVTNTSYKSQYAPIENNSPFYSLGREIRDQNDLNQSLDFYLVSPEKYKWGNTAHYTGLKNEVTNYKTTILIKPNSKIQLTAQTGRNLNTKTNYQYQNRFHPFKLATTISPTSNYSFTYDISLNMSKWIDESISEVNSSYFKFKFSLGKNKDYQWNIETTYRYKTELDNDKTNIEIDKYEMETINIVKKEHKRSLIVGYNKQLDELQFKYRLDAFPDDALELQKTKDVWKVEGRFNESAVERF
ncbi:hypothetical protein DID80_03205 [Candidatus Marinamargulisbacteria bacterium SCGC AAA071-K20]|nr:hypothetical protein DID80_03205 [Candidatus Marinamargulisbacteria bacterium SCGC AAA071-K20]